jgi:hypothetical protein
MGVSMKTRGAPGLPQLAAEAQTVAVEVANTEVADAVALTSKIGATAPNRSGGLSVASESVMTVPLLGAR